MGAVIFDVDGTLVDSVDLHARAWQKALEHFGHRVTFEKVRSQIGKGGDQLMPVFLSEAEMRSQSKALESYRGELFKKQYLSQVKGFPKVRELFQRLLNDGWQIGLASSAKKDELQTYKDISGVSDLLDAETSSDDAEKSKPFPDIFQAAVARLRAKPEDCIVVGDSPYDAQAASRASIRSIGLLCGGFPREDLASAGFLAIYADPADLLERYDETLFAKEQRVHT